MLTRGLPCPVSAVRREYHGAGAVPCLNYTRANGIDLLGILQHLERA